ncbi:MAG: DUF4253 domain-containing protein [Candidatus Wildermuthbacteria bacterium]|nr:DUF4253 domain-containing protein [Candidatus Wildermuthbacteria bacterium]
MDPTLTIEERKLAEVLGFEEDILMAVKECVATPLKQLDHRVGVSSLGLPREKAARIVRENYEKLRGRGYFIFLGKLDMDIVLNMSTSENMYNPSYEVTIVKSRDQYDILRVMETSGGNYGITTDDIIEKLKGWDNMYSLDLKIFGADKAAVDIEINHVPEAKEKFTNEVFQFAPDVIDDMLLGKSYPTEPGAMKKYAYDTFIDRLKTKEHFWLWWD